MPNIEIKNLSYRPTKTAELILDNINLTFQANKFSLLTGPSGSGKSTLLKFIAGLFPKYSRPLDSGEILIANQNIEQITYRYQTIGMVFQNPDQQFTMDTVKNELVFILENIQTDPKQMDSIMEQVLDFCGIKALKNRLINTLSGGEKQKLALACVLAMDSQVIILDEPFASVDSQSRIELLNKLKNLQINYQKTIIICDHDLNDYESLIDQLFYLDPMTKNIKQLGADESSKFFNQFKQTTLNAHLTIPKPSNYLTLDDFSLTTNEANLLAIEHFEFAKQATTLITGANGIGKSTLFKALTKLNTYGGQIKFKDKDIRKYRALNYAQQVSLLFQNADDQFLTITVQEEIELSKKNRLNDHFSDELIQQTLNNLQLTDLLERSVYHLSEGQKKKLQILTMLILNPPVLLLDEPFTGLDINSLKVVIELLKTAKKWGQTQIIISHQLNNLAELIDHQIIFANQTLTYQGVD